MEGKVSGQQSMVNGDGRDALALEVMLLTIDR
jgi:hypothetical protein